MYVHASNSKLQEPQLLNQNYEKKMRVLSRKIPKIRTPHGKDMSISTEIRRREQKSVEI